MIRRRVAALCLGGNWALFLLGLATGHPGIWATAAVGIAGGTCYLLGARGRR